MSKRKLNDNEFDNLVNDVNEAPTSPSVRDGAGKYRVSLPGLPSMEIEASDIQEAKNLYDRFTGVLGTSAKYEVERL